MAILNKKTYFSFKYFLRYILVFCVFYVLFKASINQTIYPYYFGFYLSLLWCDKHYKTNFILYILASFLVSFNLIFLIYTIVSSLTISLIFYAFKKFNKTLYKWLFTLFSAIAFCLNIPYFLSINLNYLNIVYTLVINIIYFYAVTRCYKTLLLKNLNVKLNLDEIVCTCLLIISLGSGLSSICILNHNLLKPIAIFLILLTTFVCGGQGSLICAISLGIGFMLSQASLNYIAILGLFALVSLLFQNNSKYYSVFSIILTEILLAFYFKIYGEYSYINFLFTVVPCVLIICLPQKLITNLKLFFTGDENSVTIRNIITRNNQNISKRLLEVSDAFYDMTVNFKSSIKKSLPKEEAKALIVAETSKKVCENCKNKAHCLGLLSEHTLAAMSLLIDTAFQKKKISILDVPTFLSSRCNKASILIQTVNNLMDSYHCYNKETEEKNNGKLLILEQLDALSKLLISLSYEINKDTFYNISQEKQLTEDLNYKNFHVKDVVLEQHDNSEICVSMLAKEEDLKNKNFIKTINKALKQNMEIVGNTKSNINGYNIASFKAKAKFDCVYGFSAAKKFGNKTSGDNFSCIRLAQNKVLFAICDGMGNGEIANIQSTRTINLIENFYRAGFETESIIEIVNRLITMDSEDVFSALDIALIDLVTGKGSFVKLGAQESFIKEKNQVETIISSGLPLGIMKGVKPYIFNRVITDKNIVVMCSDGVIDTLGIDDLKAQIASSTHINPQTLCDEIINNCLDVSSGKPKDDLSIIAFKIFVQ